MRLNKADVAPCELSGALDAPNRDNGVRYYPRESLPELVNFDCHLFTFVGQKAR